MTTTLTKKRLMKRLETLRAKRTTSMTDWMEIADLIAMRRGRFQSKGGSQSVNESRSRGLKIFNPTAGIALRDLSSGMQSGLTSPGRRWFNLMHNTPGVPMSPKIQSYLDDAVTVMIERFAKTNLYNSLHVLYEELCGFGTGVIIIDNDPVNLLRATVLTAGEYLLAPGEDDSIETLAREFSLTVEQLVKRFGQKPCSERVRKLYDEGHWDEEIEVIQFILPNPDYIPPAEGQGVGTNKPWLSIYIEVGHSGDSFLDVRGYNGKPFMAPRWNLPSGQTYGIGPCFEALPDVRSLQAMEKRKGQAVEKMVNPPLTGPSSMMGQSVSTLPGSITFADGQQGSLGLRPIYEVRPDVNALAQDIRQTENRIKEWLYTDLFKMMMNSDRREITAREIQELHEEKMVQLGPVLERLYNELLKPLIDRCFDLLNEAGVMPEPPEEMQNVDVSVDFIGVLAQAQKAVGTGSIERLMSFVGQLAGANPDVMDRVNFDNAVIEHARMNGAPGKLIRSDEEVEEIRQSRQQQQQMQMAAEFAAKAKPEVTAGVAQGVMSSGALNVGGAQLLASTDRNAQAIPLKRILGA